MTSVFSHIEKGAPIEVFLLNRLCTEDKFEKKVNLGVGAYRTNEGKPWVLPVVKAAEIEIAGSDAYNHEYLPVPGLDSFSRAATELLLGSDNAAVKDKRAIGFQALSGTGALRLGAAFLHKHLGKTVVYYSNPTWENHRNLFLHSGFTSVNEYRYWSAEKRALDFDGMISDLENAPEGAVIVLHACAHNPTGVDPTQDQWKKIAEVIKEKKLFTFFDSAYQGFASGDPNRDAWAVRYFVDQGFELLAAQSFAKNFGLYNERVGNLTIVQSSAASTEAIVSQISLIVRAMYSNPPALGCRIVSLVLNDPKRREEWMECIRTMSSRIIKMRAALYAELLKLETPGTWDHITQQIGMFSYTGLNENQVKYLIKEHHVYLLNTGRISMCGVTEGNVAYVAQAIHDAVTKIN